MTRTILEQLEGLNLDQMQIGAAPAVDEVPDEDAVVHAITAAWSEITGLLTGTALEQAASDIGWGLVNAFHRAAEREEKRLDTATDRIRLLLAEQDGSEVAAGNLEEAIDNARTAETKLASLQAMRETAARLYLIDTGHSWQAWGASRTRLNMTAACVDGQAYLKARAEQKRAARLPTGTPVVFAGGRMKISEVDATAFIDRMFGTLDKIRDRVGDMVLVHGGDSDGLDRFAARWAECRGVPQLMFRLNLKLGNRAGFRRNEQFIALKPRYLVAYPGSGVLERLVIDAKRAGITVIDRRGPINSARAAA
ncbi:MAG: hypothetical protein B7Y35_07240 [Sphingomonadales bacterium 28-64-96]|nr:MAG: hypothetical protein B7Y35_07240 [Sphingomonadales bacterium 28-64-96]